jgi:ribosomal protein S18 acetylase RimI-like enzyme
MVKIRKARISDLDELIEIWKRFMEEHREMGREMGEDLIPKMKKDAPEIVRKFFSNTIHSRLGLLLVIEDMNKVQGYMLSRIQKNIPIFEKDPVGYISDIFLEESLRGSGYSSKLFKQTMEWFHQKGIKEISIKVMWSNPHAQDVYAKWGFNNIDTEMRLDLN